MSVIDSAGTRQPVRFNFTRSDQNTWMVSATYKGTSGTTTTTPTTMNFNTSGQLTSPTSPISFSLTFSSSTASFTLDVANMTQYAADFLALSQNSNGFEKSNLERLYWDEKGYLNGAFTNNNSRRLYQAPLANFVSPNNLRELSGMVFEETDLSGSATVKAADASGRAGFSPGAIEQSNVDIAEEFTRMIQAQAVYNANSVAFRTNDELTITARDLAKA
jgi:flagellar hook protein FlgE